VRPDKVKSMAKQRRGNYRIIGAAAVVITFLLALTLNVPAERAAAQDEQTEELSLELLQQIFPEAGSFDYDAELDIYTVYDAGNSRIGYAFYAKGDSYSEVVDDEVKVSGPMVFLIGLEDQDTIKDIVVISQEEEPQYWDKLELTNFLDQFKDLKIADCAFPDFGGTVDAASGATISSMSVVDIVREAALAKILPEGGAAPHTVQMAWQIKVALGVMIPFILIPMLFTWYANIRGIRSANYPVSKEIAR
jgi:Na+-translocating ferredoxin:NAD+ oxidoreductase RnfG subunit